MKKKMITSVTNSSLTTCLHHLFKIFVINTLPQIGSA